MWTSMWPAILYALKKLETGEFFNFDIETRSFISFSKLSPLKLFLIVTIRLLALSVREQ